MSARSDELTLPRIALAVLAVLVVLYSLLIAGNPLSGVALLVLLYGVYLAWRFFRLAVRLVDAVERIADATEAGRERAQE